VDRKTAAVVSSKPMFKSEAEMTQPVVQWMESLDLIVKSEFVSPWGICDAVGLSFNKRNVAKRLGLQQTRAVSSIVRAALLLRVPDVETQNSITLSQLADEVEPTISRQSVREEMERLAEERFVVCTSEGAYQKLNGWVPLQKRLIAVELKLKRVEEAFSQALNNFGFADESYVALPKELAERLREKPARADDFRTIGIGLIAVTRKTCEILIRSRKTSHENHPAVQFYCVEKFWRTLPKGN
jgi:hypothetical protein